MSSNFHDKANTAEYGRLSPEDRNVFKLTSLITKDPVKSLDGPRKILYSSSKTGLLLNYGRIS